MDKHVFICHSSKDKVTADLLRSVIEKSGIKCWIAPRDIRAGSRYAEEIVRGIRNCRILVLVFSANANNSTAVASEVESAFNLRLPIIPFRIENKEPNDELVYYIKASHWIDAFSSSQEETFDKLIADIKAYIESASDKEPSTHSKKGQEGYSSFRTKFSFPENISLSQLINKTIYPFAVAFNDIKEQEIKNNQDGINMGIFRLMDLFARYCALFLMAVYRALPPAEHRDEDIKIFLNAGKAETKQWLFILDHLANILKSKRSIPKYVKTFIEFYLGEKTDTPLLKDTYHLLSRHLRVKNEQVVSEISLKMFMELMVEYFNRYTREDIKIENAPRKIKEGFIEVFACTQSFFGLHLVGIKSINPNKEEQTFEHNQVLFTGLFPNMIDEVLATSNWDLYNPGHVVAYDAENPEERIDLFPFLKTTKDFSDLEVMRSCENFDKIQYDIVGSKTTQEHTLDNIDPFIENLRKIFKQQEERRQEEEEDDLSPGRIRDRFREAVDVVENEVSNPLSKSELLEKINSLEKVVEAVFLSNSNENLSSLVKELDEILLHIRKSSFCKLKPTDHEYILSDEYKGKYIIPEKFFDANLDLKVKAEIILEVLGKNASTGVIVAIYIALVEASQDHSRSHIGVEHLMIAISKIAEKFIFDWYGAIGVSPNFHRLLTRKAINMMRRSEESPEEHDGLHFKPRFKKVVRMAVEEVNLAKRDKITIKDLLSAILREGDSLPMVILTSVFDLTRDRLLGEFYHLLKQK